MNQKNIIIYSFGRSGSNILLDTLDLSPLTFCRNEPQSFANSPLCSKILNSDLTVEDSMSQYWEEVVSWMGSHLSCKDRHHPYAPPKVYYKKYLWQLGIPQFLIHKNRTRRALSFIYPQFNQEEYQLPSWFFTPDGCKKTTYVFKTGSSLENHLNWIINHRPQTKIIILIRHPLGFAQSLYCRLYKGQDPNYFYEQNCQKILSRLQYGEENGVELPSIDINSLTLFESVIWNWLLFYETSYQLYSSHQSVLTITYEQLLANPLEQAKTIFNHCSLPWNSEIEEKVRKTYQQSAHLAQSYKNYWQQESQKLTDKILSYSSVRNFWDDQLWADLDKLAADQEANQVAYTPY